MAGEGVSPYLPEDRLVDPKQRGLARAFLAELPGLSVERLTAPVSVAPFNRDSGTSRGERETVG